MSEPQAFQDIAENLSFLDDWEDRLNYVIELGATLPPMDEADKTDITRVKGCVSNVWLVSSADDQKVMHFRGQSDAIITKGLVAILLALYSDRPAAEIAATDAIEWFRKVGLSDHLGMQRSNGLVAMVNRIRSEAQALA